MTETQAATTRPLRLVASKRKLLVTKQERNAFVAIETYVMNKPQRLIRANRQWLDLVLEDSEEEVIQRFAREFFTRLRTAKLIVPEALPGAIDSGPLGLHKLTYIEGDLVFFDVGSERAMYETSTLESVTGFNATDHPSIVAERTPRRVRVEDASIPAPTRPVTPAPIADPAQEQAERRMPPLHRRGKRDKPPTALELMCNERKRHEESLARCEKALKHYAQRKATAERAIADVEARITAEQERLRELKRATQESPTPANSGHVARKATKPPAAVAPQLEKQVAALMERGFDRDAAIALVKSL